MNETAERINGLASHDRCYCRYGCLCCNWANYPRYLVMLLLATCMIGGFVFAALISDIDADDDDDMDGGMMIPAQIPASHI